MVISQLGAMALLLGYFGVMMLLTRIYSQQSESKSSYLVADRKMPGLVAAFSIAATWVWAPSMFTAAEKAYLQGFAGVFWFVVPNVLTLILFGVFAAWMRKKKPDGWTFSDYIRENYSNRCHNIFLVESFGLQICSLAVQLLAGAAILHKISGIPFFGTTCLLAAIPLLYTIKSGIRVSIMTDFWQMIWIVVVLLVGLPIMTSNSGGLEVISNGLGGFSGGFRNLFDETGIKVMLSFGIPTTIGLLSGTFGDQMFWQRIFSVKDGQVKKAMFLAAGIFALVPISLSLFGFIAAGAGLEVADTQLTNVSAVIAFAPRWFLWLFMILIISGLLSTVDSILCAVSSVAGHDIINRLEEKTGQAFDNVKVARYTMVAVTLFAVLIANIPGLTITYLFLFYGTLRSSVFLPSIWAISGKKMSEGGLFYGILLSLCVGLPIFAYGNLNGNIPLILTGSLLTIGLSGVFSLIHKPFNSSKQ